jgi:hypothetical protein
LDWLRSNLAVVLNIITPGGGIEEIERIRKAVPELREVE